jgi:hypothetical protein
MTIKNNIVKTKDLDKRNKIIIVKDGDLYRVISIKKSKWFGWLIGWTKSDFCYQGITNLTGQKVVDGEYLGFPSQKVAEGWMDSQASQFGKRIKFMTS